MSKTETGKGRGARSSKGLTICLLLLLGILFLSWKYSGFKPARVADEQTIFKPQVLPISNKSEPLEHNGNFDRIQVQSKVQETAKPKVDPIEISGRVMLVGKPPEERLIYLKQHDNGSQTRVMSRDFEVSVETGLANVFIYVESGLNGKKFPVPTEPLYVAETNYFLKPFVMGVRVDQPIQIENSAFHHHHRLVSSGGKEFAWQKNAQGKMDDPLELVFSARDILSHITCKFHEWEWGYFGVVDHPYFAVTDKDGYFKLPKGIPPGNYTIAARHPKSLSVAQKLNAEPGGKYDLFFKIRAPASRSAKSLPITEKEGEFPEGNNQENSNGSRLGGIVQRNAKTGTPILGTVGNVSVVRGQIKLTGNPPPEKRIDAAKRDFSCGNLMDEAPMTRFYVVGENGELADTVIYLEPLEENVKVSSSVEPVAIEFTKCQLTPTIFALQTGQKLIVRNSDPLFHNVHCTPQPGSENKEVTKALTTKTELELSFTKPEPFLRIKCDVHPWEFAYASIFEHPFFAVSDLNGHFTITNVPPGRFRLHAAHRKAGTAFENLSIVAKTEYEMNITLEAK